ncbi:ATP-binding protein [Streptomyces sp. ventii]|uniref:histidine kinase n=1 Tax=Streptomyces spiramenti TaxID=2720606 RepID=A0ABX1AT47_9ACTN|nr:ATP-binding protein [Streptomyces spiramenti]
MEEARSRAEHGTKTALKTAMRTLQGLANEQQIAISGLQRKYGDQRILQDLLDIDHMNSQFGRRAQSIAVLCEGWLGRHRSVASVYDVVRSAKGRVRHFTRVEIHSQASYAVISQAVEPVALALAELLDNATSYSAPETTIDINIRAVPKGVCIVIDDAGVGMNEEEKTRAAELLNNPVSGVTGLGNPPQFGFAVMGVLAARYGFTVSVDTASPYGGVRAVVLLPQELLTAMPEPQPVGPAAVSETASAPAPLPGGAAPDPLAPSTAAHMPRAVPHAGPRPVPDPPGAVPVARHDAAPGPGHGEERREPRATTRGGLPKRRRRTPMTIVGQDGPAADEAAPRSNEETASIMGAFQRGTRTGRTAETDPEGREFR